MRWRSVAIGLLVSAFFLYVAFRQTDLHEVWTHLTAASYGYLVPASVLTLLAFWIRAVRWGWLLGSLKQIPYLTLYSATMIGFMCNNILPMRLGEFVRAYVLGRSAQLRPSAAFATIVVERLFDLFSMIAIFGLILLFFPLHNRMFKMGVLAAFLIGVAVLVLLLLFHFRGARFRGWAGRFLPRLIRDRTLRILESFETGLGIFRDLRRILLVGSLTLLMWLCFVFVIQLCFSAARLELGGELPPLASLVVMVVMAIGIMVPSGPGFVGTLQAAAVLGLAMVGYRDQGRALSFSILYHITQWFPVVLVGLVFLMREQLSLGQVGRISREEYL